uniref:SH3 domain-containing protein n=1 Tax=Lutzomyia longipalpis TaxID=7200 RepID=A0A1B0CWB7_LUTLO
MKSLSLDSPESTELHGQMRRRGHPGPSSSNYHGGSGGALEHSTPPSNNSRLHSPSSPSQQQRKLLYANRGLRTGSVDLPDDVEKSQSSASTSPCPSPKPHRLLPTNLYVVLYNFKARHQDELDLKAGYKVSHLVTLCYWLRFKYYHAGVIDGLTQVTVIDTSDPDWWKGKCLGRVGYFPSKYCTRLAAGEKPLQVTHNLQVSDGERGDSGMTLLRDQIVIQVR